MTLLADAPPGRHLAQFHRDAEALTESVVAYLDAGLRREQSILVIASAQEAERLLTRLAESRLNPKALSASGHLVVTDATTMLVQVMSADLPDLVLFRSTLMPILSSLQPIGRGTRIYSAMAGYLWQDGNTEAAIRLEELWNELAVSFPFSLYCAYTMDTLNEKSYAAPLEELGRTHSDILGTPEDEQFGRALDRASKEIFGISLTQMSGVSRQTGARRFPSGQRTMLWVKRNLPLSTPQLAERARHYFNDAHP